MIQSNLNPVLNYAETGEGVHFPVNEDTSGSHMPICLFQRVPSLQHASPIHVAIDSLNGFTPLTSGSNGGAEDASKFHEYSSYTIRLRALIDNKTCTMLYPKYNTITVSIMVYTKGDTVEKMLFR